MKKLLCMLSCTATMAYAQQEKPNVVVSLVDDMGIGDVSTYGASAVPTPNLDKFAKEGLQLNNFYSAAPVSSPARAGITTGRYPIKYQMNTKSPATEIPVTYRDSATGDEFFRITVSVE